MKDANEMTIKEFERLPKIKRVDEKIIAYYLIILPTIKIHYSGYRIMNYVAVCDDGMDLISGSSDALHIYITELMKTTRINIDCLKKSGLIRIIFHNGAEIGKTLEDQCVNIL